VSEDGGTLVVGPSWIGDMVMAQSLFIALKRDESDAPVDVLAPDWTMPLLAHMPEVSEGLIQPVGRGRLEFGTRWALGRRLRRRRYDRAIVLPNSWKSALPVFAAGIPHRTGYVGELRRGLLNDARRLDKTLLPRTVDRFVALARPPGMPMAAIEAPRLAVEDDQVDEALAGLGSAPAPNTAPPNAGRPPISARSPPPICARAGGSGCSARRPTAPSRKRWTRPPAAAARSSPAPPASARRSPCCPWPKLC
jgi:ADP-heptose:LPS heptosyltransferase